ncbi:MAG: phenylalanine--tRNA ligase subunit beta, partial [Bacteroidetes bacterium]|nr:phenylalanine--tRNA ligase subunit beta [Bacteroidota bacterium]
VNAEGGTVESERMALLITGNCEGESWRGKARMAEAADMKAEVELLMERLGLAGGTSYAPADHPLLSGAVEVKQGKRFVAVMGEVKPGVAKAFEVGQAVWYAELVDDALAELVRNVRTTYREVAKFPSVRRDLSLLLNSGVEYASLQRIAFQAERKLLRQVGLFDVYEGDRLPAGKKSYALSFILQDAEKTLTDDQVEKAMGRIQQALEKEAGAELRG